MSVTGKQKTTIGPDHDGAAKPGFLATSEGLARDHGPGFMTNQPRPNTGNLARDGSPKAHVDVPIHGGMKPQPAGGLGHPQGPSVDAGGAVPTDRTHPFAKEPSPQLAVGKTVPVSWSRDGASMRNRNNDSLHGGATPQSGCETGDAMRELGFADPSHPSFRGKRTSSQDCGD
jgi:hypothetical protein